jgi:2,4-dienoyl-CoA reductase-like NADH-dependent reductase (Old Yellow Enzyme family)
LKVDVVEVSGGSYEAPAMQGQARDGRTLAREAYFLEFAQDMLAVAQMPLMVTGGIRRKAVADKVLRSGVALVGIATALAINPSLPKAWRAGEDVAPALSAITWKNKMMASLATMARVKYQLKRVSQGSPTNPRISPLWALVSQQLMTGRQSKHYRQWMARRGA